MIKVLNLYAGIGGNRKLWEIVEVTAVEINPEIAFIYKDFFPNDTLIIGNALDVLIKEYKKFDFIWSSPPCQSHSKIRLVASKRGDYGPIIPDMSLYSQIVFLQHYFKGKWVVENVKGYYKPLIKPQEAGRHYFWSNFLIQNKKGDNLTHNERGTNKVGLDITKYKLNHRKDQILRNCVNPKLSLHIFNNAFKEKQQTL